MPCRRPPCVSSRTATAIHRPSVCTPYTKYYLGVGCETPCATRLPPALPHLVSLSLSAKSVSKAVLLSRGHRARPYVHACMRACMRACILLLLARGRTPIKPSHVKSSQLQPSQVKSSQVKSSQVKPSQAKSSQVKSSQVKPSQVKSSQVKSSQVKSSRLVQREDLRTVTKPPHFVDEC